MIFYNENTSDKILKKYFINILKKLENEFTLI